MEWKPDNEDKQWLFKQELIIKYKLIKLSIEYSIIINNVYIINNEKNI